MDGLGGSVIIKKVLLVLLKVLMLSENVLLVV